MQLKAIWKHHENGEGYLHWRERWI